MEYQNIFIQVVIYLAAAVISVPIAKRLGLGSVLGYLLAGIIIGPYALKLVGQEGTDVMHFAEFGVVLMLFLIGLELKPTLLWKMRRSIFGLGGLQVIVSAILIAGIAMLFHMNVKQSMAIGLVLALSSTAIVLQTLSEKGLLKSSSGQSSFSVLLFQDIAVIPILAILPLFANQVVNVVSSGGHDPGHETLVTGMAGWQQLLLIIGLVVVIIFGGRFLARFIFRFIAKTGLREIFTATTLLLVVGIAIAMSQVGLSPALGTFLAGVVLADNEYRHEIETDIEPFKGLLLGLFFIAIGASIDFELLLNHPGIIFGLVAALICVKLIVLYILGKSFGLRSGQEWLFAFSLAQAGEFGFVLLSFSSQNAILNQETTGILLIVVALSMLLTPLLLILNEKIIQPRFVRAVNEDEADEIDEKENEVIIAGAGRFGVVLGRFLKANQINATVLDSNPDNIRVLRKFGFKVYYGDSSRPDLLRAAGIENTKVLIIALDDREKITMLSDYVKKTYPSVKIIARAIDVPHSFELADLEVDAHRRETYDSSINLGVKALNELGYNKYQAHRLGRAFKYHDEIIMDELHKLWHEDEKHYILQARKFSEQIENILMADQEHPDEEVDGAWDVTSRMEEVREMFAERNEE